MGAQHGAAPDAGWPRVRVYRRQRGRDRAARRAWAPSGRGRCGVRRQAENARAPLGHAARGEFTGRHRDRVADPVRERGAIIMTAGNRLNTATDIDRADAAHAPGHPLRRTSARAAAGLRPGARHFCMMVGGRRRGDAIDPILSTLARAIEMSGSARRARIRAARRRTEVRAYLHCGGNGAALREDDPQRHRVTG